MHVEITRVAVSAIEDAGAVAGEEQGFRMADVEFTVNGAPFAVVVDGTQEDVGAFLAGVLGLDAGRITWRALDSNQYDLFLKDDT